MNAAHLLEMQRRAGYPARLIEHHRIVAEVASGLADALNAIGLKIDAERAELMGSIHDIGKSVATDELTGAGSSHEKIGVVLAEDLGLPPSISRICSSHSSETTDGLAFEEIVVRLADKLWKGKRDCEFEKQAISRFGEQLGKDDWEVFIELDTIFQNVADLGHERLQSTRA